MPRGMALTSFRARAVDLGGAIRTTILTGAPSLWQLTLGRSDRCGGCFTARGELAVEHRPPSHVALWSMMSVIAE